MLNENKVCFIYCYNDDVLLNESIKYIDNLEKPNGIEIEIISIKDAISITSAYNQAMKSTDAKYKVYLHQDVFIINKNFIVEMLNVFKHNKDIGLIGTVGAKVLPTSGVWWESEHKYGKVFESHTGEMKLLEFSQVTGAYEEVQAIDGLMMITQYDITWREDIFDGWHFYDLSQSMEFQKAGFKVVVPRQDLVWCIHDCELVNFDNGYSHYKEVFLNEYSKELFPLVSVLIPTYNRPEYFRLALESVLHQTYKNIEIIVGDDSTNNDTENLIQEYTKKYKNIQYYHNEKNLGQFENDLKLFDLANGEYINYLMDDDLFEVTKIEKMIRFFIDDGDHKINLVTSHRGIIDEKGIYKGIFGNTDNVIKQDVIFNGIELGDMLIKGYHNFIGEPTTVLFRKSALVEPFGVFNGRRYGPNIDQASWLNLLAVGDGVFINEVLSYFRIHGGQQQNDPKLILEGYIDHIHKLLTCKNKKFMQNNINYLTTIREILKNINNYKHGLKKRSVDEKILLGQLETYETQLIEIQSNMLQKLPLVSILIPTYNQTHFLKEALESAINQTYPNIEIIIGDDSTNDEVEMFVKSYLNKYKNITYVKNLREEMDYGLTNVRNLLKLSKGDYVNFLLHDDIFHIEKISRMMEYLLSSDDIALVTSHRQLINEQGNFIPDINSTKKLFDKDTAINGTEFSLLCLENLTNYIGELSTVLFKKSLLPNRTCSYFNNETYLNLGDLATWFSLMQNGKVVYIYDSLSYFRQHQEQNTHNHHMHIKGVLEWKKMIDEYFKLGLIENKTTYMQYITKWFNTFNYVFKSPTFSSQQEDDMKKAIKDSFFSAITTMLDFKCK